MKMWKKLIAFFGLFGAVLALTACGNQQDNTNK